MAENYSDHEQSLKTQHQTVKEIAKTLGVVGIGAGLVAGVIFLANHPGGKAQKARAEAEAKPAIDRAEREKALKDQLTVDGFPAIDKIGFNESRAAAGSTQVSVDIGIGACILRDVSATAEIDEAGGVRDVHNYRFSFTTEPAVAYPFENADDLPGVFHDQDPCKAVLDHTPVAVLR